jgi:hypothetical protein
MAKTIGMREVAANERRLSSGRTMIYALADPETLDVRYIGQTTSPGRRRWLHRSASNNRNPDRGVCRWISGLLSGGLAPVMMELEIVANGDDGETRWIAEYQSRGAKLLNMNSGGQTMEQCRRSARAITKGKRQTPLQRAFVLGKRSATEARAAFSEESAQRIDAKYRSALEAVKRAEHREGKHAARDRINQALLNRLPHVFGVGN